MHHSLLNLLALSALSLAQPLSTEPCENNTTTNSTPTPISCPPNFRNTVLNNLHYLANGSKPTKFWDTLQSHGVSNWIGFLNSTALPHQTNIAPSVQSSEIRMIGNPTEISSGLTLLHSPNPPPYLELFNEPDYSWAGHSPLTNATAAASALAPILALKRAGKLSTKLLSPALASPLSGWLGEFNNAEGCDGCLQDGTVDVLTSHIYTPEPEEVVRRLEELHKDWPGMKIWVTELAPATREGDCRRGGEVLGKEGMRRWMEEVVRGVVRLGFVERVFWNAGEWSPFHPENLDECNHSLTYENGTATELLEFYGGLCKDE